MYDTFSRETLSNLTRLSIAQIGNALLFCLSIAAVSLPYFGDIKPFFFLMVIYYWSIYRPTLLPVWAAFLAGTIIDLLSFYPLGIHAILFVLVRWVLTDQRLFLASQSFFMVWVIFCAVAFVSNLYLWASLSLFHFSLKPILSTLVSFTSTALLFPVISIALHMLQKLLPLQAHGTIATTKRF